MRVPWNPNDCAIAAKQPMSWISQPQFLFASFALVSLAPIRARLALPLPRLWHILFGAIHSVPFGHGLRAGRPSGFSTTKKAKPQAPRPRPDQRPTIKTKSAEVLLLLHCSSPDSSSAISHGYIKSRIPVKARAGRDAKPQDAPPRLDQRMFLWASYVGVQDRTKFGGQRIWLTDINEGRSAE
jgi:hypothetical protein